MRSREDKWEGKRSNRDRCFSSGWWDKQNKYGWSREGLALTERGMVFASLREGMVCELEMQLVRACRRYTYDFARGCFPWKRKGCASRVYFARRPRPAFLCDAWICRELFLAQQFSETPFFFCFPEKVLSHSASTNSFLQGPRIKGATPFGKT